MIQTQHMQLPGLSHGFFTRNGGHSTGIFGSLNCGLGSGDDLELVARNREVVAAKLQVARSHLLTAFQVHGADVAHVTEPWTVESRPKVDGLVSNTKGLAIGVLTADCAPILFADEEAKVVGAAHAGWKGALAGITGAVIDAMEKLGANRNRITATIGPTISQSAYEVGPEFIAKFTAVNKSNTKYFVASAREGHYMFDLPAYLVDRMHADGLTEVHSLARCTYADESQFFSFRRATHRDETDYGRLISAIAIN
jgi:polyphenol oxidase